MEVTAPSSPRALIRRCIGWRKQNRMDRVISYREALARAGYESIETTVGPSSQASWPAWEKGWLPKHVMMFSEDRECGGCNHLQSNWERKGRISSDFLSRRTWRSSTSTETDGLQRQCAADQEGGGGGWMVQEYEWGGGRRVRRGVEPKSCQSSSNTTRDSRSLLY